MLATLVAVVRKMLEAMTGSAPSFLRMSGMTAPHAPLMTPLFSGPGTQPAYPVDDKNLRNGLIYKVNERNAVGAKESSQMNFSRPDATDARKLNAILWQDAKGGVPQPVTSHSHSEP